MSGSYHVHVLVGFVTSADACLLVVKAGQAPGSTPHILAPLPSKRTDLTQAWLSRVGHHLVLCPSSWPGSSKVPMGGRLLSPTRLQECALPWERTWNLPPGAPKRGSDSHRRGKKSPLCYKYFSNVSCKSPDVSARHKEESLN